jgi:diguanylate cyclase (GGDEF)-like protein
MGSDFAVCYADLDNFKAYNDYYGYYFGDKVIRLTARIIKDAVFDICPEGFVGHVAGDDFVMILPPDLIDSVCSGVIKTFDSLIPYRYREEDRERGNITTTNRRGEIEQFSLLTLSIAVVINSNREFEHVGELSKMLADLKTATKRLAGSNYMVERRKKY